MNNPMIPATRPTRRNQMVRITNHAISPRSCESSGAKLLISWWHAEREVAQQLRRPVAALLPPFGPLPSSRLTYQRNEIASSNSSCEELPPGGAMSNH